MKFLLILAATVAATPYHDLPPLSRRRFVPTRGTPPLSHGHVILKGQTLSKRMWGWERAKKSSSKDDLTSLPKASKTRPDSPQREGDTHASANVVGPGIVAVSRSRDHPSLSATNLNVGQREQKSIHDPAWTKADALTNGMPPGNAQRQDARLHPAKAEGSGQGAHISVNAPEGGYGTIKKEVNGHVVKNERIGSGKTVEDSHRGTRSNEVKLSGSATRGGAVFVEANNRQRSQIQSGSPGQGSSQSK